MLVFLDVGRSVRYLNLPRENTVFELNFKERSTVYSRAVQAHLNYCVSRERLGTSTRMEATSRTVDLFYELFHTVNKV